MKKKVVISIIIIVILFYIFNVLSFNKNDEYLRKNIGKNDRIVQNDNDLILTVSEQNDNTLKIKIVQKYSPNLFEKKCELVTNLKEGYFDKYTQTHYIYIAGRTIKTEKTTAPAGASDGYLTWSSGYRLLPSIVVIETEFMYDDSLDIESMEIRVK